MDADLMTLAEAHGVVTWYDDWHREHREVSSESVIGVLALLGVDASTPAAVARALDEVSVAGRLATLPGTLVVRRGPTLRMPKIPSTQVRQRGRIRGGVRRDDRVGGCADV